MPTARAPALTQERIQEILENEWLNLGDTSLIQVTNPFDERDPIDIEQPLQHVLKLMRCPAYFSFTCKHLFKKTVTPQQLAILRELWLRPFPMLIGSRGMGKSFILALYAILRATLCQGVKVAIVGAAFRQAKVVFEYCEEIWHNAPLLRDICRSNHMNGPRRDIDRCTFRIGDSMIIALPLGDGCLSGDSLVTYGDRFGTISDHVSGHIHQTPGLTVWGNGQLRLTDESYDNGFKDTRVIRTAKGFQLEGTLNHRLRVLRDGSVEWLRFDQMQPGDKVLIDRSIRWHAGQEVVSEDEAYALGAMIGDGCYVSCYRLGFATTEPEHFIPALERGTGYTFTRAADGQHWYFNDKQEITDWRARWGLKPVRTIDKVLPPAILGASRQAMSACLRGLFDTDGGVQVSKAKGGTSICVSLTNTSEQLMRQVQYILLHYGIVAHLSSRDRKDEWNTAYELHITGKDVTLFAEHIGFALPRKAAELQRGLRDKVRSVSIGDTIPGALQLMREVASENRVRRGAGTSDSVAVSVSRLSKKKQATQDLARRFLKTYGHLEDERVETVRLLYNPSVYYDEIVSIEESSCQTFDIHVPDGHEYCANGFFSHNTKIRGQRANVIVADEFASIPVEIFENVVSGFAAVSMDPIAKLKAAAQRRAMHRLGLVLPEKDENLAVPGLSSNQTILSGTAYYGFNHFCDYWRKWKAIVESKGEKRALEDIFRGEVPEKLDWRDYSVIRIPVRMLPEGFMDERHVAKARATIHLNQYLMEYGAVFAADSNGFFKRSLVESCVVGKPDRPISHSSCGEVNFNAVLRGEPTRSYVMAIDPASEKDNFSVVVLELWPDHRRIVHCWTTTRSRHKAKLKKGLVKEQDFYSYTARRIRDLMTLFPCERIALDSQGGGVAVMEALADHDRLKPGEKPILPVIDPEKPRESDNLPGDHILELISFAKADWVSEANHGLRKDMEDKALLFPEFNPAVVGLAIEEDKILGRVKVSPDGEEKLYDTLEDCTMEIEELKDELASIVHTQVGTSGRDRWDTPEVKLAGGKKGRLRKDRYSALLMANMVARTYQRVPRRPEFLYMGGFAHELVKQKESLLRPQWQNPDWYEQQLAAQSNGYGAVVRRS